MVKQSSNGPQKTPILNSISLNTSRNRMSELFNDFKQMNITDKNDNNQSTLKISKSNKFTESRSESDSIELVKVTNDHKPDRLLALYVGDLDLNVTEEILYNYFKKFKSLSSVKICYAPNSKNSLGYGYVNFENSKDAKTAIDELNYTKLLNKEIRIMESLQGKDKKIMGTNVFISNLNTEGLNLRLFYEKFKKYGKILSCKLNSLKKQGFISFEDKSVAEKFVHNLNDSVLDGSKIYCAIHLPKSARLNISNNQTWKGEDNGNYELKKIESDSTIDTVIHNKSEIYNHSPVSANINNLNSTSSVQTFNYSESFKEIYVKGLPVDCSETEVLKLFSSCGKIVDVFLQNVPSFKSSWCLITFEANESAINAVETYHKTLYKGKRLTCVKALKKMDRKIQLFHSDKSQSPEPKSSKPMIESAFKLYLYNLPEGLNENFFKLFLRSYTFSGKILRYSINSSSNFKDYSYIEFENETDAKEVNAKLNGINICGYTLVSALEKKNIGINTPTIKRASSIYQDTFTGNRRNSEFIGFRNPSSIALSPNAYQFAHQQQNQLASALPPPQSPLLQSIKPTQYGPRINSHASRSSSIKEDYFKKPSLKSESTIEKLKDYALQHIDFLIYPAATRSNNLTRIVNHIYDTCWENDAEQVLEFLKATEFDPSLEESFKEKLVETIKLFGFQR